MKLQRHPLTHAVQIALGTLMLSAPVMAQSQDTTDEKPIEEVIVTTGSLIKGADIDGAMPVTKIDAKALKEAAASSLGELFRESSQTGGSGTFSTSTGSPLSSGTPIGAGGVSMRGLSTSSTLTLVNGPAGAFERKPTVLTPRPSA